MRSGRSRRSSLLIKAKTPCLSLTEERYSVLYGSSANRDVYKRQQHPSVQVFLELMSRYHISVDQLLHGETMEGKSTERMQFETLLDELTDAEIKILTATAQALLDARTDNEGEN